MRSDFTTFPSALRGRASRNRTWRGRLYLASRADAPLEELGLVDSGVRQHDVGDDGLAPLG